MPRRIGNACRCHHMPNPAPNATQWLLWDGDCGFCHKCIRWVEEHDLDSRFRAVAFQKAPSPPMTDELRMKCREAVQVVTRDGVVFSAGRACAFVLEQIGFRRLGRFMQWRAIRPIVEWGYRRVANNRGLVGRLVFGKTCET